MVAGDFSADALHRSAGRSGAPGSMLVGRDSIANAGTRYSGLYKIAGTTTLDGDPVAGRRVYLFPHNINLCVGGVYSAANGTFLFDGIALGKYTVWGIDVDGETNGVIWDYADSVAR